MLRLALCLVMLLGRCGHASPTVPEPPPAPQPSPPPEPSPLWPPIAFPLRADGSRWIDAAGRDVWRWGAWDLYGSGWTVPSLRALSRSGTLQRLADAGVNFVGARPGPQNAEGPDGYACNEVLGPLTTTLSTAYALGQVVEVALFDLWVIEHYHSCDPSWRFIHFQGRWLTPSQLAWLETLAPHVSPWSNVVLLDGNEMFKAKPSVEWFRALKAAVRRLFPGALLGTNSENRLIEREADFVTLHQDGAAGVQSGKPTCVTEMGPDVTPQSWARESQAARRQGTCLDLWRGSMSDEQWAGALRLHAEIRKASGR